MHFDLDSHDAYATTHDDPARLVPNPAKKKAHKQDLAARARYERALAATDTVMLDVLSPPPGESVLITNAAHDALTEHLRAASANLDTAQAAHGRSRPGCRWPRSTPASRSWTSKPS